MKIKSVRDSIKQVKEFEGLVTAKIDYAIKSATAEAKYLGPFIPKDEWRQMLSFFKWTHDTFKSESQVRLFCNTKTREWKVWAFPQKEGTGMSAIEIDDKDASEQRAQFKDSEGWIYFGTVHHHCGATAFQSGTDAANEQSQDGLHITIGKIDEKQHDMHCRFYLNGACFEPDMSQFWELDDAIVLQVPEPALDMIARYQMCIPSDVEFPQQWKDNVKTPPRPKHQGNLGLTPYGNNGGLYGGGSFFSSHSPYDPRADEEKKEKPGRKRKGSNPNYHERIVDAANEYISDCERSGFIAADYLDCVEHLADDMFFGNICEICKEHDVNVADVITVMSRWMDTDPAMFMSSEEKDELKKTETNEGRAQEDAQGYSVD